MNSFREEAFFMSVSINQEIVNTVIIPTGEELYPIEEQGLE
jgi:hypothetical protein